MFCTVVIIFSSWTNFYLNYNFTIKIFLDTSNCFCERTKFYMNDQINEKTIVNRHEQEKSDLDC